MYKWMCTNWRKTCPKMFPLFYSIGTIHMKKVSFFRPRTPAGTGHTEWLGLWERPPTISPEHYLDIYSIGTLSWPTRAAPNFWFSGAPKFRPFPPKCAAAPRCPSCERRRISPPGVDVMIFENLFVEKFGENLTKKIAFFVYIEYC
jgi:hypothetical protein